MVTVNNLTAGEISLTNGGNSYVVKSSGVNLNLSEGDAVVYRSIDYTGVSETLPVTEFGTLQVADTVTFQEKMSPSELFTAGALLAITIFGVVLVMKIVRNLMRMSPEL